MNTAYSVHFMYTMQIMLACGCFLRCSKSPFWFQFAFLTEWIVSQHPASKNHQIAFAELKESSGLCDRHAPKVPPGAARGPQPSGIQAPLTQQRPAGQPQPQHFVCHRRRGRVGRILVLNARCDIRLIAAVSTNTHMSKRSACCTLATHAWHLLHVPFHL